MQLGMVGLGKMGLNMTRRLLRGRHAVIAYDRDRKAVREAARAGAAPAGSLEELVRALKRPRRIWLMIPAGAPVREAVRLLGGLLEAGDTLIDGGNSRYKDAAGHAETLGRRGVGFMDVGVSGGIWGLREGYCLMAGGEPAVYRAVAPLLKTLARPGGFARVGPVGAGHFVKMIHNGIEYALMQAYAEGFELLKAGPYGLDLGGVASLWNRGSVVRSWLLELAASALAKDPELKRVRGWVSDSGEGRWTVLDAVERGVPASGIALSLFRRFRSRQTDPFADKLLAALRAEFGGHPVRSEH